MYIAFPDSIRSSVRHVSPGFWRLQAVVIEFGRTSTLLINSYFPTDPQRPDADQAELLETLGHIRNIIRKNDVECLFSLFVVFCKTSRHSFDHHNHHSLTSNINKVIQLGIKLRSDMKATQFTSPPISTLQPLQPYVGSK